MVLKSQMCMTFDLHLSRAYLLALEDVAELVALEKAETKRRRRLERKWRKRMMWPGEAIGEEGNEVEKHETGTDLFIILTILYLLMSISL